MKTNITSIGICVDYLHNGSPVIVFSSNRKDGTIDRMERMDAIDALQSCSLVYRIHENSKDMIAALCMMNPIMLSELCQLSTEINYPDCEAPPTLLWYAQYLYIASTHGQANTVAYNAWARNEVIMSLDKGGN